MPSTRNAIFVLAAIVVLGGLVYFLVPLRPGTPGPVSSPEGASRTPSSQPAAERSPAAAIKPRAVAESEPAEGAASSRSGALEIEVIGPKGGPASNARLVLTRGKDVLAAATTDVQGLAKLASGEGDAALLIVPEGAPRHETTISIAPGRRRVELPRGELITGSVEVDGAPPKESVRLWADTEDAPFGERSEEVWRALGGDVYPGCTTSPSGAFELDGLRPGSEWTLGTKSVGYRHDETSVDGRVTFAVTAPSHGVVLKLSRIPVIRGRVVSGPDHAPVGRAILEVTYKSPTSGMTEGSRTRDDGRFEFPAVSKYERDLVIKRTTLAIHGQQGRGEFARAWEPPPDRDLDLGDVELAAPRSLRYEVRDTGGAPIAGALARASGDEVDQGTRTDAQGLGTVPVPTDAKSLVVGALKYEVQEVPLPEPMPDVLRVVLQPAAGLEIQVRTPEGTPADVVRVRVSAKISRLWSAGEGVGPHAITIAAGATKTSYGSSGPRGVVFWFPVPADGRVVAFGLKPGVPITIGVFDQLDHELAGTTVTLAAGERKTVELRVTRPARTLKGRVRDAAGRPVADARVSIGKDPEDIGSRCTGSPPINAQTDADGRFLLAGLFEGTVHLAVNKNGWVPLVRKDLELPPEDVDLDLVLETGFTVTVEVVGADGNPVKDLDVSVSAPGYPDWCQDKKSPGVYAFTDFPKDTTAKISLQWAAKTINRTVLVKSDVTETITLPAVGKVLVDFEAIDGDAFTLELRGPDVKEDQRPNWSFDAPASGSPRTFLAQPVLPGEWEAVLLRRDGNPAAPAQPVTVKDGETSHVTFRKS